MDLPLSSLFAGWAMADEVQGRLAGDGLTDLRFADGFGARRVEAARRLLDDVVADLGADAAVRGRRVRAPR